MTSGGLTRRVVHGSLTQTLVVGAPADAVFTAFSDPSLRTRWFRIPAQPGSARHDLDFRPGGHESLVGTVAVGGAPERIEYRSRFLDVMDGERIVFTTELLIDSRRRSVSLVTVELTPQAEETLVTYTEQYAFLDVTGDGSAEIAEREGGTKLLLNRLRVAVTERQAQRS
jgi:uncharacterized protein YndB with AHSA1/START domain